MIPSASGPDMSDNGTPQATERPAAPARASGRSGKAAAAVAILAVLLAWQWLDTRGRLESLRAQVAERVRDSETDSRDARILARQAQESLRDVQAKQSQLEIKLAESQSQQV